MVKDCILKKVSIHTPTKGVTKLSYKFALDTYQFQSTHPRRVWHTAHGDSSVLPEFQSTHPRRVWQNLEDDKLFAYEFQSTHPRRVWLTASPLYFRNNLVSIHTPTKGVTLNSARFQEWPLRFNPHTHEGCDFCSISKSLALFRFNPHTHEGCDFCSISKSLALFCFNPHTHEGCDLKTVTLFWFVCKFQSTHPRRVWPIWMQVVLLIWVFQSTHPRRVWRKSKTVLMPKRQFQSTHPRRVWHQ